MGWQTPRRPLPGGSPGRCSPQPRPQGTATSADGAGAGNRLCCGISPCFEASPWRWQQGAELCTVSQPCSHAAGSSRRAAFLPRAAQSLPEPPTSPSQQLSLCVRAPAGGDQSSAGSVSHKLRPKARICDLGTVLHRQLTCHGQAPGAQHSPGGAAGPWVGHARPVTQQKEPPGSSPPSAAPAPSPARRALTP